MTIKIDDLIPLLKKGWIVKNSTDDWYWFKDRPKIIGLYSGEEFFDTDCNCVNLSAAFDIEKNVDWKKSLIEVVDNETCN